VTVSTSGETVQNLKITGTLTIAAPNVTVNNVCVTDSGNSGNMAVWVDSNATNLLLEHSTFAGASAAGSGVIDTGVWNAANVAGVTANAIYIYNAAEDWHGSGTVENSYLQAGAYFGSDGGSHNEDVYLSDTSITLNHDTLLNSASQTAVLFGDDNGGSCCIAADNHWTVIDSLLAGGGYLAYLNAEATGVGSSTMDIQNNRFCALSRGDHLRRLGNSVPRRDRDLERNPRRPVRLLPIRRLLRRRRRRLLHGRGPGVVRQRLGRQQPTLACS